MLTLKFKAVNHDFMLVVVASRRPPSTSRQPSSTTSSAERDLRSATFIYITHDDLSTLAQAAVDEHISISSLGFGRFRGYVRKLRDSSFPTIESVPANTPCFLDKLALAVFGSGCDAAEFKTAFSAAMQRIATQMQHRKASGGPFLDTGCETAAKMLQSLAAGSVVGYGELTRFLAAAAVTLHHPGEPYTPLWDGYEKRIHHDQDGIFRCRFSPIQPSPCVPVHREMPVEGANEQSGIGGSLYDVDRRMSPPVQPAMPFAQVHQEMPVEVANEQSGIGGSLYDVGRRILPPIQSPQDLHHPADGFSVDREMSGVDDGVNMGLIEASNGCVGGWENGAG